MKKILFIAGCVAAFQFSSVSFADEAHPCKSLEEACKSAGFYKGGSASHKGLFKDCIQPLTEGKTITGVTVSSNDVMACKAKIEKMQEENKMPK